MLFYFWGISWKIALFCGGCLLSGVLEILCWSRYEVICYGHSNSRLWVMESGSRIIPIKLQFLHLSKTFNRAFYKEGISYYFMKLLFLAIHTV